MFTYLRRILSICIIILNLILLPTAFNLINIIPVMVFKRKPRSLLLYYIWARINAWAIFTIYPCKWKLPSTSFTQHQNYILISNHKSLLDILIISSLLQPHLPIIHFVMKSSLKWQIPGAGLTCYLLGYPMLRRYSYRDIKKNPQLAQQDLKAIEKSFNLPKAFQCYCIFPEGTRAAGGHPEYHPLGPPKYSGLAHLVELMRSQTQAFRIIDCDIIYPEKTFSLKQFLTKQQTIEIDLNEINPDTIPSTKDYLTSTECRLAFQKHFKKTWHQKTNRFRQKMSIYQN